MTGAFSYQRTVQSLARVLSRIEPTPWDKVTIDFHGQLIS